METLTWLYLYWRQNQYIYAHMHNAEKMKFSIKDFFIKCNQIRRKLRIWSHLRKKSLMENFIFCKLAVETTSYRSA